MLYRKGCDTVSSLLIPLRPFPFPSFPPPPPPLHLSVLIFKRTQSSDVHEIRCKLCYENIRYIESDVCTESVALGCFLYWSLVISVWVQAFLHRLFYSKDVSITVWFLGICLFSAAFDLDEKSLFDTGWKQRFGLSLPVELALQALLLSYEGSRSQVTCLVYDKAQYFSSFFMYLQKSFFFRNWFIQIFIQDRKHLRSDRVSMGEIQLHHWSQGLLTKNSVILELT